MVLVEGRPCPLPLLVSRGPFSFVLGGVLPLPVPRVLAEDGLDGAELALAEILLAAPASATLGPAPAPATGVAPPSSSSASSSAAASAASPSAPMEQVPQ